MVQFLAAEAAREAAHQARAAARTLASQADEQEQQAVAAREEATRLNAPDAAEIERLRAAETEWEVAQAKLSVGFVAEVTLLAGDGEAQAEVDGESRSLTLAANKPAAVEADRDLTLTIPEVATFRVQGGGANLRSDADAAERRWQDASSAVFGRTGCDTLQALVELKNRADELLAQADELARNADSARLRADGLDALEQRVVSEEATVQRRRAAVEEFLDPDESVEAASQQLQAEDQPLQNEASLTGEIEQRKESLQKRQRLCDRFDNEISSDARDLARQRQELAAKETRLADGAEQAGDWQATLQGAEAENARFARERSAVETELESIRTEATTQVEAAREASDEADRRLAAVQQAFEQKTGALAAAKTELAHLQGQTGPLRANAEGEDLEAAQAALEAASQALAELPAGDDTFDIPETERQALRAKRLVADLELELRKAEGALEQMGGQVLEEQREQVEEAVKALDSRERELELDYEAWRLLRDTLTEADEASAAHLGSALVEPVSRRMGTLTGGRYGDIAIGPQLNATGIALAGGDRPFTSLSIGTQEQIALLLRLAIAEALGTFLILDDQLTQSDTTRMNAMHGVLTEAAERVQVVIFTCHPTSYPLDAANVVDLTEHIHRSDPAPESPATEPPSPTPTTSKTPTNAPPPRNRRRRRQTPESPGPTDTAAALKDSLESG